MTDGFDNFLEAIGGIGKAAGIDGDGPGGLNALQRAGLDPDASANLSKQTALSQLANDPNFQGLPPAAQASAVAQITGNTADLQRATALSQLSKINLNNPRDAIQQGVQTGNLPLGEGITAITNPNMGLTALNQLNNLPATPTPAAAAVTPAGTPPVVPAGATGAPAASSATPATPGGQPAHGKGIDQNYLNMAKQVFPAAGQMAENMINGLVEPQGGKGENDPIWNAGLQIAQRADSTFSPQSLIGRPAMVKNIASGKIYTDSTNLNSVAGHLYDLNAAAPLLKNSDHSPMANYVVNGVLKATNKGNAQGIQQYESILSRAAPELNKFYVGGEGDKEGRAAAGDAFKSDLPQATIQNNIRTQLGLLKSKASSMQAQVDGTMGNASTYTVITPEAQALIDDIDGKPLTAEQQQLVNNHRLESNLPPKTWDNTPAGAAGTPAPAPAPATNPSPSTAGITPEMARAELARRAAARGGNK